MKIYFVRHGESEGNVKHEINDNPERVVNLTARGRTQAEAAAEQLRNIPFTHAYVSEFPRAQQTAQILLRNHELPLNVDARLNERRSGMDGLHVDVFNNLVRADYLNFRPPHGESFREQMQRMCSFLNDAVQRHPQGIALAVSHESPIVAAMILCGEDESKAASLAVANCGVVELKWLRKP
jgi:broad specificity phosphatase PhoE